MHFVANKWVAKSSIILSAAIHKVPDEHQVVVHGLVDSGHRCYANVESH